MKPRTAYDRRDEVQFLDVRELYEWDAGHIEGSTHVPMDKVPVRLDLLDRDRPIVTVCRSGRRSGDVADYLTRSGYSAENLIGGLQEWEAERLPLVRPGDSYP